MTHSVIEEIIESNNWRDGEFAKYKINPAKVEDELWCRMCIPMIYAHWEGFVVDALKILLKHLNSLQLRHDTVKTNLVVISLEDSYKTLSGKQSFIQRIEFTKRFCGVLQEKIKFNTKINTKSNLKSDVLKEICEMFCFDFSKFSAFTSDIDRLVSVRNSIAHGENAFLPNNDNIKKYIEAAKNAMDTLIQEIENFLREKRYLLGS